MSETANVHNISDDNVHCLVLLSTYFLHIDCIAAHTRFCLLPFYIFIAFVHKRSTITNKNSSLLIKSDCILFSASALYQ